MRDIINLKAVVPAAELEVKTEHFVTSIGIQPANSPRPDLAGLRVKLPNAAAVYLIDPEGFRRWIPNPTTYNNLFRDWGGIIADINITQIPETSALSDGAILARPNNGAPVFLVSNGVKRWITSPAAMDKYNFSWGRVYVVPHVLTDFIPSGASWS